VTVDKEAGQMSSPVTSAESHLPAESVFGMSLEPYAPRVFIIATSGDLIEELDALQKATCGDLRKYFREPGARPQVIDPRWGVSQEATLDQQPVNICLHRIDRCQRLSFACGLAEG